MLTSGVCGVRAPCAHRVTPPAATASSRAGSTARMAASCAAARTLPPNHSRLGRCWFACACDSRVVSSLCIRSSSPPIVVERWVRCGSELRGTDIARSSTRVSFMGVYLFIFVKEHKTETGTEHNFPTGTDSVQERGNPHRHSFRPARTVPTKYSVEETVKTSRGGSGRERQKGQVLQGSSGVRDIQHYTYMSLQCAVLYKVR